MATVSKKYIVGKDCIGFMASDPAYQPGSKYAFFDDRVTLDGWLLFVQATSEGDIVIKLSKDSQIASLITVEEQDGNIGLGYPRGVDVIETELGMDSAAMEIGTYSRDYIPINTMSDGYWGNCYCFEMNGKPVSYILFGWFAADCDTPDKICNILSYNFAAEEF